MKKDLRRIAKKCAAVMLSAALVFNAGDFPAPVFSAGTVNAEPAGVTCGAFTVVGGAENTDFSYADGVLTVKTATALTIKNTNAAATTDRIEVAKDVSANITLAEVNIDVSGTDAAAFNIADDSTVDVTVTLAEGTTNILKSGSNCAGMQMNCKTETNTETGETAYFGKLIINATGSGENLGKLEATGGDYGAGIGSGTSGSANVTIKNGIIKANGGNSGAGIGSGNNGNANVTIENGNITAQGGNSGAGVGSGNIGSANVIINGGTINVTGGYNGAGIGSGNNDSAEVTINNGTITATGGKNGAGIGGGGNNGSAEVTINGGTVESATGGDYGAGIGSGKNGSAEVTIENGNITAQGGRASAGIGGGSNSAGGSVTINGGTVENAKGGGSGAGIGSGYESTGDCDVTISGGTVIASSSSGAGIGSGYYSTDSCRVDISGGIVTASSEEGAGIGSGCESTGGCDVIISGGTVTANSTSGEGIGDGYGSSGSAFYTDISGVLGSAFIFASSISDTSLETRWFGVIFQGIEGKVYGTPTRKTNAEIPSGKTLTIPNDSTLTVAEGVELTINGTLNVKNGATLDNRGTLNVNGTITNNSNNFNNNGGTLTFNEGASLNNNGTIYNGGTLNVNGEISNSGTINNNSTLNVNEGAELINSAGGTIKTTSYGTLNVNEGANFNNSGETVNNGTLNVNGKISNDGELTVKENASLISNGTITNNKTITINENGTFTVNIDTSHETEDSPEKKPELTNSLTGTITNKGTLTVNEGVMLENNGELTVEENASLINNNGVIVNFNTITNNGTISINNNNNSGINNHGTISNNGTLTVGGEAASLGNYSNGTIDNNGTLTVGEGATLFNENTITNTETGTLTIDGDIGEEVHGTFSGEGTFEISKITEDMISVPELFYNGTDLTTAITNGTKIMIGGHEFNAEGWKLSVEKISDLSYRVTYSKGEETVEKVVNVNQSGTLITTELKDGKTEYAYGETITITATAKPSGKAPSDTAAESDFAPSKNGLSLFYNDSLFSSADITEADGIYTVTVSTVDLIKAGAGYDGKTALSVRFDGNANMAVASKTVEVTLKKKELTIASAVVDQKTYDGKTTANVTGVTLSGLLDGDSLEFKTDFTAEAVFENANAGENKDVTVTVTLNDTVKNYTLPTNTFKTTQTINKADVTLTFANQEIIYGETPELATANPESSVIKYSFTGSSDGDGLPKNAGTYTVTATVDETTNYNSATTTITLKINPKTVSTPIIELSESSFVYDGNAKTPTVTVKDGETEIPSGEYTVKYDKNTVVGTATVTITDNTGGNYTVSGSTTFEITKAAQAKLEITEKPTKVVYGDEFTLSTSGGSGKGDVSWTVKGNATVDGGKVTVKGVGEITVTATKASDGYYEAAAAEWTFTADPKTIKIKAVTLAPKTYDGNTNATVTGVTFEGLVGADELTLNTDFTAEAVFENANAGTNKTVKITVTPITETARLRGSIWDLYVLESDIFTMTAEIKKAAQTLTVSEDTYENTYGDEAFSLNCTTTGDGKITYSSSDTKVVTVSDSGKVTIIGAGSAVITVSLAEGTNYTGTVSKTINVTVNKAGDPPNKPVNKMSVPNSCDKVGSAELPEGWKWSNSDKETALTVGTAINATACYVGTDKGNYKNIEVTIEITRSKCDHAQTKIDGIKDATCTESGYTGDLVCTDCKAVITTGTETEKLAHEYRSEVTTEPTVDSEGVRTYTCVNCGGTYTESIPKLPKPDHKHNYTSAVTKAATCTENGVKTYTCDCGDSYTETIAALGHDYHSEVTKEPTTSEEGVRTYTCSRCGDSYTESIPKLDTPDNPKPDTDKPFIKGEDGKEGWDVIRAEVDITKDGGEITVEMNGTTEVPGDILNSIKGEDITITFDIADGVSWSVNGKDVTEAAGSIDFGVTVGSSDIPVDIINNVTGENYSQQLSLNYDGNFGFTATLSIGLGAESAGCYASLYYYNEQSGEPEFISESKITENGIANLEFTHASDYIVVVNEKSRFDEGDSSDSSDTSDSSSASGDNSGSSSTSSGSNPTENPHTGMDISYIAVLIAAVGVIVLFIMMRKKKDSQR